MKVVPPERAVSFHKTFELVITTLFVIAWCVFCHFIMCFWNVPVWLVLHNLFFLCCAAESSLDVLHVRVEERCPKNLFFQVILHIQITCKTYAVFTSHCFSFSRILKLMMTSFLNEHFPIFLVALSGSNLGLRTNLVFRTKIRSGKLRQSK